MAFKVTNGRSRPAFSASCQTLQDQEINYPASRAAGAKPPVGCRKLDLPALEESMSLKARFLVYTPLSMNVVLLPSASCNPPHDHG